MLRAIPRLVILASLLFSGQTLAQDSGGTGVRVRVGEHPGFSRMVFDWPTQVPYRVERSGSRAKVIFERPAKLDLSRYRSLRQFRGVKAQSKSGRTEVVFTIPEDAHLDHFRHRNGVVIDVFDPRFGAAGRAALQRAVPAPQVPSTIAPAIETPAPATAQSAPAKQALDLRTTEPEAAETQAAQETVSEVPPMPLSDQSGSWLQGLSLGPNVSTLGLGAELGYKFNDFFGLRLGANHFSYESDYDYDDIDYDTDITLESAGGVIDIYPFAGSFRISGGLRYNGNEADLSGTPKSDVKIGGDTFTPSEVGTLTGDLDFREFAPYAGIGFAGSYFNDHLVIGLDIGVHFQGKPDVSLSGDGSLSSDPTFLNAIDNEIADIEDDLSFLQFYPVLGVSATYRF